MIKEIEVKGLFGRFSYRLPLGEEKVTVLTGPNGAGKSTIFWKCYGYIVLSTHLIIGGGSLLKNRLEARSVAPILSILFLKRNYIEN